MPRHSASEIAAAARAAGWSGDAVVKATAIALAESGGDPSATNRNLNGTTDRGVWQINSVHADILASGNWSNLADNARMAYKVYANAGNKFTPWVAYKSGAYIAFLPAARRGAAASQDDDGFTFPDLTPGFDPPWEGPLPGGNPLSIPGDILGFLGKGLSNLTSGSFWQRIGLGALGLLLIIFGLVWLLSQSKTGKQAIATAKTVATKGAA